jgi:hypothetical protein
VSVLDEIVKQSLIPSKPGLNILGNGSVIGDVDTGVSVNFDESEQDVCFATSFTVTVSEKSI